MRKILYVSGTRADYGLMKHTLKRISDSPKFMLDIIATGMHLMEDFGHSIDEIKKDGFKVHEINAVYEGDSKESMSIFIGEFIQKATKTISEIRPDIIIVLGDRAEMLGAAIIGAYLSIPVAHLHGGEISSTVDEAVRHSITKLAHIHLPATKRSAERIKKMGEDEWRINVVGAPGLDYIMNHKILDKTYIERLFDIDLDKPCVLVLQHPVTMENESADSQMKETLNALKELGVQTIIVYPNADAGGRKMINAIKKYENVPYFKIYKNIRHEHFISLMSFASVMAGNSSSGIIEAPSFGLPVVNIGTRQDGRERAGNIIDAGYNKEAIKEAIKRAMSENFIKKAKRCKNPYGDGRSSERIIKILSEIKIDEKLLQKRLGY